MMSIDEFTELFEILTAAYPGHKFKSDDDMGRTIVVWYSMLSDLPNELLEAAIHKHILQSANSYFPSINEIRIKATEVITPESNTAAEAWGEVVKAITEIGLRPYDKDSNKALDSLKPLTRKVVEAIGFRTICMAEEESVGVVRGQFLKMYDQISSRQKQEALLPEGLREKINELAASAKGVKSIGDGRDG